MQQYKILFSGPVGAGKSSAIKMLSDIDVVSTEAKASDQVKLKKENTTVAMDYGRIQLDVETLVHLYGTPGQVRFNFMWEILSQGALGLVLLIDGSVENIKSDVETYLDAFQQFLNQHPLVIGLTHTDRLSGVNHEEGHPWQQIQSCLINRDITAPVFEVDARNKEDINMLVQALILSIDPTAG